MVIARFTLLCALLSASTLTFAQAQTGTKPARPPGKPATGQAPPKPAPKPAAPTPPPPAGIKPEDRAREMTASMTKALGLAAPQAARVQEINLLSVQRVEEARRTYARQLPRMHAEIELIGNSRLSLLKDVLTEQQFKAFAAMREKKMGIPEALKQQATLSESAGGQ